MINIYKCLRAAFFVIGTISAYLLAITGQGEFAGTMLVSGFAYMGAAFCEDMES